MRTRTTLFFSAALLPAVLLAQQKFVPGYIVTLKGDTIRGEVKLNEKKPQDLYMKVMLRDDKGMQKTYKPGKINGYGYDQMRFVSLDDQGEPVFFRVLASGHVNLLELKYEGLRMNKPTLESEYYIGVKGEKHLQAVKERNFRKQLTNMMSDNVEIAAQYPDDTPFEEEAALSVINAYNTWKSGQPTQ